MTREEQIAIASCAYGSRGSSIDFTVGAKWADSHPKSPWISVDEDLPCNHSDLVLTYNNISFSTKRVLVMTDIHTLFLCEMKKDNDRGWIWNYSTKDKIVYWFPIPEPPKIIENKIIREDIRGHCNRNCIYWNKGRCDMWDDLAMPENVECDNYTENF